MLVPSGRAYVLSVSRVNKLESGDSRISLLQNRVLFFALGLNGPAPVQDNRWWYRCPNWALPLFMEKERVKVTHVPCSDTCHRAVALCRDWSDRCICSHFQVLSNALCHWDPSFRRHPPIVPFWKTHTEIIVAFNNIMGKAHLERWSKWTSGSVPTFRTCQTIWGYVTYKQKRPRGRFPFLFLFLSWIGEDHLIDEFVSMGQQRNCPTA